MWTYFRRTGWLLAMLIAVPILVQAAIGLARGSQGDGYRGGWQSTGTLAPASVFKGAVIRVYAARAGHWKAIFATHHWLVFKTAGGDWQRYEVVGWGRPVRHNAFAPDAMWHGNPPWVVFEARGEVAARAIPALRRAIAAYPWRGMGQYRVWPGPNSNTFIAYLLRAAPQLEGEMAATGIGKDYLGSGLKVAPTISGTGWQVSLAGLVGIAMGRKEGLEIDVLGATIGLDVDNLAIMLPGLGKLGLL